MLALHHKLDNVKRQVEAQLPTKFGRFKIIIFADSPEEKTPHFALVHNEINFDQTVTVRIHSECLTGDILGSAKCDCGDQLAQSLSIINKEKGALIYLRQEGRGIGLINKIKAYKLQDEGRNTIDANLELGFEADQRHYDEAIEIMKDLGIKSLRLLTNNPEKINALDSSDIELVDRVPLLSEAQEFNEDYLQVKKELMGHLY